MRKLGIFATTFMVLGATTSHPPAQVPDGPRAAVDQLFLGMRMADAAMVREVLAPDVRFAVLTPEGAIATQGLESFVQALAASQGNWNEQIYDVEVRVDDAVASVWAPYTFYLAGRVSHCGINSMELLRGADGWEITQISDTRRMEGCPDPLRGR
jgi:hypothetical protein